MLMPITNSQEWKDCLRYIAQRTKEQSYNAWLKPTSGAPSGNGNFDIAVPNQFVADWISQHFRVVIEESFREVLGKDYLINYVITKNPDRDPQTRLALPNGNRESPNPLPRPGWRSNLNERYSFNTLVVGDFSETGFTTFHRLHRAVYGNDHTEGFLKMADARSLLANAYHVIREVVTPLNITYIASRNRR